MTRCGVWLTAIALLGAAGCSPTTMGVKDVTYSPKVLRAFPATAAGSAQLTNLTDEQLNADGFIQLGALSLATGAVISQDAAKAIFPAEAAKRGGQRFRIATANSSGGGGTQAATTATVWHHAPEQAAQERAYWRLASAVRADDAMRVEALLKEDREPNASAEGQPPVMLLALRQGNPAMVDALVKSGADLKRADTASGRTIAEEALFYPAVLRNVLAGMELDTRNSAGRTLLMTAAQMEALDAAATLLSTGASANAADSSGVTALMIAAERGNAPMLKLLLLHGASPNAGTKAGKTALMFAASSPGTEKVRLLLDSGARVDATTETGMTALMFAASAGRLEAAELLLDRGASAGGKNTERGDLCCTALAIAKARNHGAMAELLRKRGAAE